MYVYIIWCRLSLNLAINRSDAHDEINAKYGVNPIEPDTFYRSMLIYKAIRLGTSYYYVLTLHGSIDPSSQIRGRQNTFTLPGKRKVIEKLSTNSTR